MSVDAPGFIMLLFPVKPWLKGSITWAAYVFFILAQPRGVAVTVRVMTAVTLSLSAGIVRAVGYCASN
ncbi:hypothetical protein [Koleobacter methoxysyntrophicus]|uniref:hypothetical protein n=1 Tax=Koleobacter methoxysyntrophicus TaxID=2751313 RepID=UPI0019D4F0E8|nr:hypothetical protein [Koleobacter methoxysyntrophicus]